MPIQSIQSLFCVPMTPVVAFAIVNPIECFETPECRQISGKVKKKMIFEKGCQTDVGGTIEILGSSGEVVTSPPLNRKVGCSRPTMIRARC